MSDTDDKITEADLRGSSSIDEFCTRHGIGKSLFHKLQQQSLGPRLMRIGTKVRISHEAELRWIRETENRDDIETAEMLRRKARAAAAKAIASPTHISKMQKAEA